MNQILALFTVLSKEEHHEFMLYLKRKNRRGDAKNLLLYKLIAGGHREALDIEIYGKPSKNAYHALCKRLQDRLIDFIAGKSFAGETSEELEILKLLLACRIFFEKKQFKIAFKTLDKAERAAKNIEVYSILNEIYHTKIQYAHLNPNWRLTDVITASESNWRFFQQEYQLNLAYAHIKGALKNRGKKAINDIIIEAFTEFHIEIRDTLTYKSLYQLMEITSTAAKLQSDYFTISPFMEEIYGIIRKKGAIADKHRYYHIHILHLMAITYFRNKQFQKSMRFVRHMEEEMNKNNRSNYKRFLEKLTVIKALNLNYTDRPKKALSTLETYPGDSLNVELAQMMCLFQQERFKEAHSRLIQLKHSDHWYEKKMGWQWVLKKNIFEILLLIELDKLDMVLLRMERFKRTFSKRLKHIGEKRVLKFIHLAGRYYEDPKLVKTPAFKDRVQHSFTWVGREREDVFVMSFYAWLKAKMQGDSVYSTTLELVRQVKK